MQKQLNNTINLTALVITIAFAMFSIVSSQRPSYAGSRPEGGLNQKDKYRPGQYPLLIGNRFGDGSPSNPAPTLAPPTIIAFGASQRPPVVSDYVSPQPSFVPLPTQSQVPVTLDNRIGGTDNGGSTIQTSSAGASGLIPQNQPMPLDAHGDRLLIEQLNSLPVDRRPFWYLNYQAIEAHRNGTARNSAAGAIGGTSSFQG